MMTQRGGAISYTTFAGGFGLLVYVGFYVLADMLGIRIGVFRTFGRTRPAAYVLHGIIGGAVKNFIPRRRRRLVRDHGLVLRFLLDLAFRSHAGKEQDLLARLTPEYPTGDPCMTETVAEPKRPDYGIDARGGPQPYPRGRRRARAGRGLVPVRLGADQDRDGHRHRVAGDGWLDGLGQQGRQVVVSRPPARRPPPAGRRDRARRRLWPRPAPDRRRQRLTTGKAVGADIWNTEDLSGNRPEATLENARLEGVAERVEVKDGDARRLPFADGAFDVIVTKDALHNIYNAAERRTAVREIVRILRPGGQLFMGDVRHTGQYMQVLRECGLEDLRRSAESIPSLLLGVISLGFVYPANVTARKPAPVGGR